MEFTTIAFLGLDLNSIKYTIAFKQSGRGGSHLVPFRKEELTPAEFEKLAEHKSPARPTNGSQAPHVQASARTQRTTQDKHWDCGPCRSHRPVPAHVSRDREGTCGHAIRRSWCLQNPSGRLPAFPWSQDPGDSSVRRAPKSSAGCRACVLWPAAIFLRRRVRGSSCLRLRRRTGMLLPGSATPRDCPGKILLQLFDDGEIGIEHVQGLLREVAHIQAGAEAHASRIWSTGSGNHLEQRGLARAVSSHDGPAFSAADGEIESFINHTRAVTLVQILKDGHLFAGSWGDTKL